MLAVQTPQGSVLHQQIIQLKCYAGGKNSQSFKIISTKKHKLKCYAGGTNSHRFIITSTNNSTDSAQTHTHTRTLHNQFKAVFESRIAKDAVPDPLRRVDSI